ncbi:MAG: terminase small subunit-like protein [Candidatus Hodarchaeales archaeon]|jgi:hypothetical protein
MDNLSESTDLFNLDLITESDNKFCKKLAKDIGPLCKFTEQIGIVICFLISQGYTVKRICSEWNEDNPDNRLNPVLIYKWLKNDKLKNFHDLYYYARESQTNQILDDIMDMEEEIKSGDQGFKSGRVVLESKRWRAKVQNPGYFNPGNKDELTVSHEFIIKSDIPQPQLLDDNDIIDAEIVDSTQGSGGKDNI